MSLSGRKFFCAGLFAALPCAAGAAGPALATLPALSGNASGVLNTPDVPDIHWRAVSQPAAEGRQSFAVAASADGLTATATVTVDPQTGAGTWELRDASLDLAVWLPVLAARLNHDMSKAITMTGRLQLTGHGVLPPGGQPDGELTATLREATLTEAGSGLTVEGLGADFHLAGLAPLNAPGEQVITFKEARVAGLTLHAGRIVVALPQVAELQVKAAGLELLGGRVELEPLTLAVNHPVAEVRTRFAQIDFAEVLPFLAKAGLSEATGRLDGQMALQLAGRDGLVAVDASFAGSPAGPTPVIRLTPVPGLLTGHMPERLPLLPPWTGPLRQWTALLNPVFAPLQDIELGKTSLHVDSLRLHLDPQNGQIGHRLRLQLAAQPVERSLVPKVTFDLNVDGPLQELLQMNRDKKLSF